MSSSRNRLGFLAAIALCLLAPLPGRTASAGFRTRELPWAALGAPYRAVLETYVDGRCIDGGVRYSAESALPPGLELHGETISGVPEVLGAFAIRLRASNGCGEEDRDFVLQVTGRPILQVAPQALDIEYRVGGPAPEAKTVLVSATWPKLAYDLNKGSETWLRVRQQAGVTPLPGSPYSGDVLRVQIVPANLTPGTYESAIVISGPMGAAAVTLPVRLRVVAAETTASSETGQSSH